MTMKLSRYSYESWLHHKEREWISGRYPGPLWARFLIGCIYFARRWRSRIRRFKAGQRNLGDYLDSDLVYAAGARCKCGAGLAYPHNVSTCGEWVCSAALKGEVPANKEHEAFPFMFYEINSEGQPSANGRTTRPGVQSVRLGAIWNKYIPAQ